MKIEKINKYDMGEVEAALYLERKPATLQWWRSRGKGPRYIKKGKFVYYQKKDLDNWIQSITRKG